MSTLHWLWDGQVGMGCCRVERYRGGVWGMVACSQFASGIFCPARTHSTLVEFVAYSCVLLVFSKLVKASHSYLIYFFCRGVCSFFTVSVTLMFEIEMPHVLFLFKQNSKWIRKFFFFSLRWNAWGNLREDGKEFSVRWAKILRTILQTSLPTFPQQGILHLHPCKLSIALHYIYPVNSLSEDKS